MKIIFVFAIFGLVAARSFTESNFEELSTLHAKVPKTELTTMEIIEQIIENKASKSPCKQFIFKGRSTIKCGKASTQKSVPALTKSQKARLARYLNFINKSKLRF